MTWNFPGVIPVCIKSPPGHEWADRLPYRTPPRMLYVRASSDVAHGGMSRAVYRVFDKLIFLPYLAYLECITRRNSVLLLPYSRACAELTM